MGSKAGRTTVSIWPYNSRDKKINCKNVSLVLNGLSLVPIRFRTSMYQYSFFPHAVIFIWNKLVSTHNIELRYIVTVSVFKYTFFKMHFTSSY